MSTKFIIAALQKLTVTVVSAGEGLKKAVLFEFQLDQQGHFGGYMIRPSEKSPENGRF